MLDEFCKNGKLSRPSDKKKVKYNSRDDSDAQSDSEPSDDNLDQDEIMKLIPKKWGKAKYLKGLLEKKKVVQVEEKKEIKKKPKATLMPCMIQIKKERDRDKSLKSEQPTKKQYVQKTIVTVLRKGGKQRDVGTQIPYVSDGRNLSLMEQDILATTGCRWSKIIYPGYKGVRPSVRESFISVERLLQDCQIRNGSEHRMTMSTPTKQNNFMSNFKQNERTLNNTEVDKSDSKSLLKCVMQSGSAE